MTATLEVPARTTGTTHAVRLAGVSKTFGHGRRAVTALEEVDLEVAPGEFVCLLGASGCGKTTVLNLVASLDKPTAGSIELNTSRPAVMFQEAALMPWLTAARNVELPLRLAGVGRAERRVRTTELLSLVRLHGVGDKRPHELSGGMRQRVALARALASAVYCGTPAPGRLRRAGKASHASASEAHRSTEDEQPLLLMDEPFSSLDAITRDVLQSELQTIWRTTGTAVLFVTHDVREAVRLGQRVVLMSSRPGTVVEQWNVDGLTGGEELGMVEKVNARLREVISSHAAA